MGWMGWVSEKVEKVLGKCIAISLGVVVVVGVVGLDGAVGVDGVVW